VLTAGAFQLTACTSWVKGSVTVNGASPPTPAIPPWQPAQLNPPSAVEAKSCEPQLANRLSQPSCAPACRLGSKIQYSGNATTMIASMMTPRSCTRSSRGPSRVSSS
jgi:hypothetical protein